MAPFINIRYEKAAGINTIKSKLIDELQYDGFSSEKLLRKSSLLRL